VLHRRDAVFVGFLGVHAQFTRALCDFEDAEYDMPHRKDERRDVEKLLETFM
jgi:hypothetical protein